MDKKLHYSNIPPFVIKELFKLHLMGQNARDGCKFANPTISADQELNEDFIQKCQREISLGEHLKFLFLF